MLGGTISAHPPLAKRGSFHGPRLLCTPDPTCWFFSLAPSHGHEGTGEGWWLSPIHHHNGKTQSPVLLAAGPELPLHLEGQRAILSSRSLCLSPAEKSKTEGCRSILAWHCRLAVWYDFQRPRIMCSLHARLSAEGPCASSHSSFITSPSLSEVGTGHSFGQQHQTCPSYEAGSKMTLLKMDFYIRKYMEPIIFSFLRNFFHSLLLFMYFNHQCSWTSWERQIFLEAVCRAEIKNKGSLFLL